ncbi:MAG: helix-turn-helix domain-containing protein [Candidatus Ventricola sp.]
MQGIPRALYARIERELHAQPIRAFIAAEEAMRRRMEDAHSLKSPALDGAGGKPGGPSNRVQDGALSVLDAERMLEVRRKWAQVAILLDKAFSGTETQTVARLLYTDGMRPGEIARQLGVDRQTVSRRRDEYVTRAALLAAERGLIRMSDYDRRST